MRLRIGLGTLSVLALALFLTGVDGGTSPSQPAWVPATDAAAKLLTAIAAFGAVITASVAYLQYRTNKRTSATQEQIALATAFTELLGRADGRVATVASEAAIAKLFELPLVNQKTDPGEIRGILQWAGTIGIGNGAAAQAAAIECVAYFGCRYAMLNGAALEGLAQILKYSHEHRAQIEQAIQRLQSSKPTS